MLNCPVERPPKRCSVCGISGHTVRNCPQVIKKPQKTCAICCGITDRRPEKGLCSGCKRPYKKEAAVTVRDILEQPVGNGHIYPGTGGW